MVLHAGRRAVGLVVDDYDQPVVGAEVHLAEQNDRGRRVMRFRGDPNAMPTSATDSAGRFAISDLDAGRFDLAVAARGFGPVSVPGVEIPEGAGEVDLGTVVLPPGVAFEGQVVDGSGQPIAGVEIRVSEPSRMPLPPALLHMMAAQLEVASISGADGRFAVHDRREGERLDLSVAGEGYVPAAVAGVVVPPAEPIRVVLRPFSRVSGQVVDERGEPIVGASVRARPEGQAGSGGGRFAGFNRAVSDQEGRFEVTDVEPGPLTLEATAEGFQPARLSSLDVPMGEELSEVELVMRPGTEIRGTVRDAAGEAVAGVMVTVSEAGGTRRGGVSGETDGDGRYQVSGVGSGLRTVSARGEGSARASKNVEVETDALTVDLQFSGGVEVAGRVVDSGGVPVAEARVSLSPESGTLRWRRESVQAFSSRDGSFTAGDVPPGTYRLQAEKSGFANARGEDAIEVGTSAISGLEIRLGEGATVSGRILGLEIDELALVTVRTGRLSGQVDFEGRYSILNVSVGEVLVFAEIPGTGRQVRERVTIEEGALEATLDLEFGVGYILTGSVRVGDEPLAGARISLSGRSVDSGANGFTDNQGRFRLEGLASGTYSLAVRDFDSGISHDEEIELLGDDEAHIEIGTGRLSGRVLERAGSGGIEGVQLALVRSGEGSGSGRSSKTATSDSRGVFSLGAVPAGSWRLTATKAGFASLGVDLTMTAGEVVEDYDLIMNPAGRLILEVSTVFAAPPAEVFVAFLDGAGERVAGGNYAILEGGRVEFTTVPDGSWEMLVASGTSATTAGRVTVPGETRVQLVTGGSLRVEVRDLEPGLVQAELRVIAADGRPYRDVGWGGRVSVERSLRSGRASVSNLPPGTWTLNVTATDGRTWTGTASVTAGGQVEAILR